MYVRMAEVLLDAHGRGEVLNLESIRHAGSNVAHALYNVTIARQKWHIVSDKFLEWVEDEENADKDAVKLRPLLKAQEKEEEEDSKTPLAKLNLEEERAEVKGLEKVLEDKRREFKEEVEAASAALKQMKAEHKKVCRRLGAPPSTFPVASHPFPAHPPTHTRRPCQRWRQSMLRHTPRLKSTRTESAV